MATPKYYTFVTRTYNTAVIYKVEDELKKVEQAFDEVAKSQGQGGLRQTTFSYTPDQTVFSLVSLSPTSVPGVGFVGDYPSLIPDSPLTVVWCYSGASPTGYECVYYMLVPETVIAEDETLFNDLAFEFLFSSTSPGPSSEYQVQVTVQDTDGNVVYTSALVDVPINTVFGTFDIPRSALAAGVFEKGKLFKFIIAYFCASVTGNFAGHSAVTMRIA